MATIPETPSPRAWVTSAGERLELEIQRLGLTEWQVAQMPHGDLRKALGALEAVLGVHGSIRIAGRAACTNCLDAYGEHEAWPCETVQAITRELPGEET
jgi:hypothetical protein